MDKTGGENQGKQEENSETRLHGGNIDHNTKDKNKG